tara:strand:- start:624 stop:1079 length:456 start_codon:yes stop_codon:yes gene_type:complete
MKIVLVSFLFLLTSCGFKPMYSKDTFNNYYFEKIELIGNKSVNKKLINSGIIIEDNNIQNNKKLIIESKLVILETSKNSEGLVQTYRSILNTNFTFLENDKITKKKSFNKSFSYPNKDNRFELLEYQNTVEKNLTNEIIKDIIIFLNINDN